MKRGRNHETIFHDERYFEAFLLYLSGLTVVIFYFSEYDLAIAVGLVLIHGEMLSCVNTRFSLLIFSNPLVHTSHLKCLKFAFPNIIVLS